MARTFTKAEFEQAVEQALAQRLTVANDDDDDETSSQHGEEEAGVETIGVNAIASISKKRKKSAEIEEIFEKSGSSSSSNNDRKRIAVVAKAEIKCQGTTNAHMWDVAEKLQSYLANTKLHHDREELNTVFSPEQRLMITQVFSDYRDEDGAELADAEDWLDWGDNTKLGDILKALLVP
jgi:hypothetical protein